MCGWAGRRMWQTAGYARVWISRALSDWSGRTHRTRSRDLGGDIRTLLQRAVVRRESKVKQGVGTLRDALAVRDEKHSQAGRSMVRVDGVVEAVAAIFSMIVFAFDMCYAVRYDAVRAQRVTVLYVVVDTNLMHPWALSCESSQP